MKRLQKAITKRVGISPNRIGNLKVTANSRFRKHKHKASPRALNTHAVRSPITKIRHKNMSARYYKTWLCVLRQIFDSYSLIIQLQTQIIFRTLNSRTLLCVRHTSPSPSQSSLRRSLAAAAAAARSPSSRILNAIGSPARGQQKINSFNNGRDTKPKTKLRIQNPRKLTSAPSGPLSNGPRRQQRGQNASRGSPSSPYICDNLYIALFKLFLHSFSLVSCV